MIDCAPDDQRLAQKLYIGEIISLHTKLTLYLRKNILYSACMSPEKKPHNAHDRSQRLIFGHARVIRDLLTGFVREPWVDELDLVTLESLPSELLSGDLPGEYEERRSDVVWKVRWKDRDVIVVVLLELQSSIDDDMALRMNTYVMLLYQRFRRQGFVPRRDRLPLVFPVVFYNGDQPWTSPLELGDLIQEAPPTFEPYRPSMRYMVIDEKRWPQDQMAPLNVVSGIIRTEQSSGVRELDEALELFDAAAPESPENKSLRRDLLAWLSKVVLPSRVEGLDVPKLKDLYEFKTYMETNMHSWSAQWKEEGLQQGLEQGLVQGLEKSILALLETKFGAESAESALSRIREQGLENVERWMPRILSAETVDAIFKDPS